MSEPIKIVRLITKEVSTPRLDGTPNSALYRIPFELSAAPPAGWATAFVEAWNHPQSFTSRHRPGIASVLGRKIVLDGTTVEEVESHHKETLMAHPAAAIRPTEIRHPRILDPRSPTTMHRIATVVCTDSSRRADSQARNLVSVEFKKTLDRLFLHLPL